jgi:hypothetical protein
MFATGIQKPGEMNKRNHVIKQYRLDKMMTARISRNLDTNIRKKG